MLSDTHSQSTLQPQNCKKHLPGLFDPAAAASVGWTCYTRSSTKVVNRRCLYIRPHPQRKLKDDDREITIVWTNLGRKRVSCLQVSVSLHPTYNCVSLSLRRFLNLQCPCKDLIYIGRVSLAQRYVYRALSKGRFKRCLLIVPECLIASLGLPMRNCQSLCRARSAVPAPHRLSTPTTCSIPPSAFQAAERRASSKSCSTSSRWASGTVNKLRGAM